MGRQKLDKNKKLSQTTVSNVASKSLENVSEIKITSEQLKTIQDLNNLMTRLKNEFGSFMYNVKTTESTYLNKIKEVESSLQEKMQKTAASYNLDLNQSSWNLDLTTGIFKKK